MEQDLSLNQVSCAFRSIVFATRKDFSPEMTELEEVFQNNLAFSSSPDSAKDGRLLELCLGKTNWWRKNSFQKNENLSLFQSSACFGSGFGKDLDGAFMWDFSARNFDLKIHRIKELKPASQTLFCKNEQLSSKPPLRLAIRPFPRRPHQGAVLFLPKQASSESTETHGLKNLSFRLLRKAIENSILDEFERFESEALVSIERHFLKEEKMALSLSLIAQSKAQKLSLIWCSVCPKIKMLKCLLNTKSHPKLF